MNFELSNLIPVAVTICTADGEIIYMNDKAAQMFKNEGGYNLIGKNLFDCHNEKSKMIIKELIEKKKENIYSIENKGKKKIIYQAPWYENNVMKGLIELAFELPENIPHCVRE